MTLQSSETKSLTPTESVVTAPEFATSGLTPEEQAKAQEIAGQINVGDSQFVLQYGAASQSKISGFADKILDEVRTKDTGYVGDTLTNLVIKIKDLNVDQLSAPEGGFLSKIPIIGSLVDSAHRFIAQYEKVSVHIETLIDNLESAKQQLMKDIIMFDGLFQRNLEYFQELNVLIAAGEIKLKELNETVLPQMKVKAESTNDPLEAQKYNDIVQMVNRFEKKLHDLKLSKMISIQTAPQIRLIQNNDQVLVEKIQSSILTTIPLWKNQIVIAIGIYRGKKALEVQREVTDTTNELLAKNSELLKTGTIEIAKESERGIVEIETLKKVNSNLISTLEETIKIQQDGRNKRQQAEVELKNMEQDLKNKLAAMNT